MNVDFVLLALSAFTFNQSLHVEIWDFHAFDYRRQRRWNCIAVTNAAGVSADIHFYFITISSAIFTTTFSAKSRGVNSAAA